MWCRTILTAVAISYVICMLLLSGLQKDDLDASTLEKLGRHNVNIDDMNNEKRRQACLLSSYLDSVNDNQKLVTSIQSTENYSATFQATSATNYSVDNDVKVVEYPKQKLRVPENLEYKTASPDINENKTAENIIQELQSKLNKNIKTNDIVTNSNDLENFTQTEEQNGLQIEYVENKPDLQSVMNFWSKLTHYTKTVTKVPTTPTSHISEEKNVTTVTVEASNNNAYVHSREMEFISRILAEYLASQTVSTTTQRISANSAYINFISRKIDPTPEKPPDKEIKQIIPTNILKLNLSDYFNQINNLTQFQVHPRESSYSHMIDETNSMPSRVSYESKYNQQIKNVQDTPYNQIFTVDTKTVASPKYNPIRFLDNLLHMKNEDINDNVFTEFETTTNGVNLIHLDNLARESFSLPTLFKYLQENDSNLQNINRNQNIIANDNTLKNLLTEGNRWEPSQNYKMINHIINIIPIDKKNRKNLEQGVNDRKSEQYKAVPSNTNKPERINSLESSTFDETSDYVNKSKQMIYLNNDIIKVIPPAEINKSKQGRNFEMGSDVFKSMLPSIKQAKRNPNLRLINNEADTQTELNNFNMYDDRFRAVNINDDQFKNQPIAVGSWKTEPTKNSGHNSKALHNDQFQNMNMPAVVNKYETMRNFKNQINATSEYLNNSVGNVSFVMNGKDIIAIPMDVKNLRPVKKKEKNINEPQAIPDDIIREIAEKVKQIVLKDIEETTTRRLKPSPPSSTSTTTTVPAKITTTRLKTKVITTETPSSPPKEITEANRVIQKLMEMFNEFKAIKESAKSGTQTPINIPTTSQKTTLKDTNLIYGTTKRPKMLIQTYPLLTPTINQNIKKTPIQVSPYGKSMIPIPITSSVIFPEKIAAHKLAPQNQAPQNQVPWYLPVNLQQRNEYHSGAITIQTNSDEIAPLAIQISRPGRLINQHIIVTTKSPAEKLKEEQERESKKRLEQTFEDLKNHRDKLKLDFSKKVRFADNLKKHDISDRHSYKSFNNGREKPWRNLEYTNNFQHFDKFDSRFRNTGNSNYPGSSSYVENISHQRGYGHTSSYPGGDSQPEGMSQTTSLYRPRSHRIGMKNEISSRDEIRLHTGSYGYNEQDRQHQRYDTSKFHERLERIDSWPRNHLKEHRHTTKNCCEEVPSRHQVPLTKVKQRTRFDESHFSNFLKSQQKVTDMLEKILANNMKARSVETP